VRVIHLLRKPVLENTGHNVLTQGCGALHIDATRIAHAEGPPKTTTRTSDKFTGATFNAGEPGHFRQPNEIASASPAGRWPTNLLLEHTPSCTVEGTRQVPTGTAVNRRRDSSQQRSNSGWGHHKTTVDTSYGDAGGRETIPNWHCPQDTCPVHDLDHQSGSSRSVPRRCPHDADEHLDPTTESWRFRRWSFTILQASRRGTLKAGAGLPAQRPGNPSRTPPRPTLGRDAPPL
jgi:hypothetical protein